MRHWARHCTQQNALESLCWNTECLALDPIWMRNVDAHVSLMCEQLDVMHWTVIHWTWNRFTTDKVSSILHLRHVNFGGNPDCCHNLKEHQHFWIRKNVHGRFVLWWILEAKVGVWLTPRLMARGENSNVVWPRVLRMSSELCSTSNWDMMMCHMRQTDGTMCWDWWCNSRVGVTLQS